MVKRLKAGGQESVRRRWRSATGRRRLQVTRATFTTRHDTTLHAACCTLHGAESCSLRHPSYYFVVLSRPLAGACAESCWRVGAPTGKTSLPTPHKRALRGRFTKHERVGRRICLWVWPAIGVARFSSVGSAPAAGSGASGPQQASKQPTSVVCMRAVHSPISAA